MKAFIKKTGVIALCAVILLSTLLACAGCSEEREYTPQLPENTATPPSNTQQGGTASFEAELYFVSEDGRKLYPEEHTLSYGAGVSRAEAAIRGLTEGPSSALLRPSVPEGINLEHVELSLDVCNAYFTGKFPDEMRAWLTLRAAVASTVSAAEGIDNVNVFFNGVQPDYMGRPLGTLSPVNDALDVYLKSIEQEYSAAANQNISEAVAYESHTATLYFADLSRSYMVAKTTELTYPSTATHSDIADILFGKLRAGDSSMTSLEPVLPANASLNVNGLYFYGDEANGGDTAADGSVAEGDKDAQPSETDSLPIPDVPPVPQDGEEAYIIDVSVSYGGEYSQEDIQAMCAALTLTLSGYLPGIDGVRISVVNADTGESTVLCEDYFERSDFRDMIGHGVTLYYPNEAGMTLIGVTRIVPDTAAYEPSLRLSELLQGPADPGVTYPGFSAQDIEAVYVVDGVAVINWKEGFIEKLRDIIDNASSGIPRERRELMFVYGVINTLTELPYVERVWMLENGLKLATAKELYLGNPLVRSPGLLTNE